MNCQDSWINWPSCIFMAQDKVDYFLINKNVQLKKSGQYTAILAE